MTTNQYCARERINQLMTKYVNYSTYAPAIIAAVGTGEFTRKEYNANMPNERWRRNPSPTIETLVRNGIISVVRQETFTIEKEGKGEENFEFELPTGEKLTEEQFCEIPFEKRLSMSVKVTAVKGKQKIEGIRYYYQLIDFNKDNALKSCLEAVTKYFNE